MAKAQMTPDGWRREKQDGHSRRASWLDYRSPAIYLLTLVTVDRQPLFGQLVGETIHLSPLGEQIAAEIERIPTYRDASSIEVYSFVVMPDHVHILLQVHDRLPKHLGSYIGWFKLQCSDHYNALSAGPSAGSVPDVPPRNTSTGPVLADVPARNILFAPEYHDRVLTHKGQLANMKNYILDNPRRLALKRANPDLFRLHRQTLVGGIACTTLGNIFLADYPQRAVLQCSRSLTPADISALRDECLAEAANGTIYITAAISEGEKTIARTLREAGYPLIILLENGFPKPDDPHYKYFKPQGVYFEACAAGRLLLVEPSPALLDRPDIAAQVTTKAGDFPHTSKRYRFLALNALAAEIAGK